MKKIGFVVAMSKEMSVFMLKLGKESGVETVHGFLTRRYEIGGKELYLIDAGVGEISSALATFVLVNEYTVDCIINFGVCGSLNNALDIADIVFVKSVFHFDRDTSPIDNCEIGFYPEFGEKYLSADEKMLENAKKVQNLPCVICASSEKFVANTETKQFLISHGADICEMESAGVVVTCKRLSVPCLLVKAVSDKADESASMSFSEMLNLAMQRCSDFLYQYIQAL